MISFAAVLDRQRARIRGDPAGSIGHLAGTVARSDVARGPRCLCGCGCRPAARARFGPTPVYATAQCRGRLWERRQREREQAARPSRLCAAGCGAALPPTPLDRIYCSARCSYRAYRRRRAEREPAYRRRDRLMHKLLNPAPAAGDAGAAAAVLTSIREAPAYRRRGGP